MKKATLALLGLTTLISSAYADQFKTIKEDISLTNYEANISYPTFFSNSIPAYSTINKNIRDGLIQYGCATSEEELADDDRAASLGYYYDASAKVVGLNRRYVGLEITYSDYCGGAHPNYGTYNLTFDSKTGESVMVREEIPLQNVYSDESEAYRAELAEIMYNEMKRQGKKSECYDDLSKSEAIENMTWDYPSISGLARFKKVIIRTSPAHANAVCGTSVRVSYNKVKKYIKSGSILHKWLK
jgi:hypothetical protein